MPIPASAVAKLIIGACPMKEGLAEYFYPDPSGSCYELLGGAAASYSAL
jgi:hypothetical protein